MSTVSCPGEAESRPVWRIPSGFTYQRVVDRYEQNADADAVVGCNQDVVQHGSRINVRALSDRHSAHSGEMWPDPPSAPDSHCGSAVTAVSYTHLRAHETGRNLVCRLL